MTAVEHLSQQAVDPQRIRLGRFLAGSGLEIGPGHNPYPLPFGAQVTYVDRWHPAQNRTLFPELGDAGFAPPQVIAHLDVDRLSAFEDESQDFVIASHVLEHVAEPIGLLDEIHRVLKPGGVTILLLPDRDHTFDRHRAPTGLDHLVDEFRRRVEEVDDDHVEDFLLGTEPDWLSGPVRNDPRAREELFELHRRRSIHVHCWNQNEFLPVLTYALEELGQRWDLLDVLFTEETSFEFGLVLQRSLAAIPSAVRAARFLEAWDTLRTDRVARATAGTDLEAERRCRIAAEAKAQELQAHVEHWERRLRIFRRPPLSIGVTLVRRVQRWVRATQARIGR